MPSPTYILNGNGLLAFARSDNEIFVLRVAVWLHGSWINVATNNWMNVRIGNGLKTSGCDSRLGNR
jgi:hypothetical protein